LADPVSSQLYVYACVLRDKLRNGSDADIFAARDQLRSAMVANYASGYWKDKPQKLRDYMSLLYRCDILQVGFGPVLTPANRPKAALDL
jgi:hypothetical protein